MLFNNVYIFDGYIFDKDMNVLMGRDDMSPVRNMRIVNSAISKITKGPVRTITGPAIYIHTGDISHCHWLNDNLSRALIVKKRRLEDMICIAKYNNDIQFNSLISCGLKKDRIIQETQPMFCASVYCFEYRYGYPCVLNRETYITKAEKFDLLRKTFLDTSQCETQPNRIYISRNHPEGFASRRRKIVNEHDFLDAISKYGFQTVYLESMSIDEQARMIFPASVVIAPHGAGLFNLVFCDTTKHVDVLELFGDSKNDTLTMTTSMFDNITRHVVYGTWQGRDMLIDIDKVDQLLKEVCETKT